MGYQLWTSPITGHRRIGTRLYDVNMLFDKGITVSAIFEPLESCPANANAQEIKKILKKRDFNVAGVMESEDSDIVGYVLRSDLESGIVGDHLRMINPGVLIADSTPIRDLFELLSDKDYLFVLNKTRIEGIVTQSDLNKPPVRIYLFSLVSLLEMHLGFWIRSYYENELWKKDLSPGRFEKANDLYIDRKNRNQEIDLFECLQFSDKRDLLLKNEKLRCILSIKSKKKGEVSLKHAEDLRNSLAHSQKDVSSGMGWNIIFETISWMERLITKSDNDIEKRDSKRTKKI